MAVPISIKIIGAKAIIDRFRKASKQLKVETRKRLLQAGALIQGTARKKVSGPVLKVRTGQLRRSLLVRSKGSGFNTVVTVGPTVNYAAAHEFGATIPDRFPVKAKALRFTIGGQTIFAKRARGFKLKRRPFMEPSLRENQQKVVALIGGVFKAIAT